MQAGAPWPPGPSRLWRPLHEALAWIITRNVEDTEAVARLSETQFREFHFPERKPDGSLLTVEEYIAIGKQANADRKRISDGLEPLITTNSRRAQQNRPTCIVQRCQ
jgi:hypothetical protein